MGITAIQREQRKKHLGSSDMAAILGIDPYRNAYDVWLDKTGKLDELKETEAMKAGTMFESGVLEFAEEKLGKLIRNQYRSAQGFPLASNVDALIVDNGEPVEAKTAGLFGPLAQDWGDMGTDQVPYQIIVQTHVHMLCTEKPICHIPAFLGGRGFQMFRVDEDKEVMSIVCDKSIEFWDDYVVKDQPPPDIIPSIQVIKRMKRLPEKVIAVPTQMVQNWLNSKESLKMAKEIKESSESELLAALGDAEAGQCELGLVTYFLQERKGIDSKRLKEEKPEVAKEFMKISSFRVPRLKKPKKAKF